MSKHLALVHTVTSLVGLFSALAREMLPADAAVTHIADELLLQVVLAQGALSPFIYRRVAEHVIAAEAAGADVVMLTCSSISPCAEPAGLMVGIPVLKIDEPMVDRAVALGARIGVAATVPTTLKPTTELVYARAAASGRAVAVEAALAPGAYAALSAGDPQTHDCIVRETLQGLMARNDVVILAQASMARVVETIPQAELVVPVLSSPRPAMERARDVLLERAP